MISSAYTRFDNSSGRHRLSVRKLEQADARTDRVVKKAKAYFRLLPGTYADFDHFDPAMHLLRNPGLLEEDTEAVANTLDRFEAAFERVELLSNVVYSKLALGGFPAVDCAFINTVDELHGGNHISELPEST